MKIKYSVRAAYDSDYATYALVGFALVTVLLGAIRILLL